LFSSDLLLRAHLSKAPFLQCSTFFNIVSIQEMLALVPVDGLSNYVDLNLEYSIRDLNILQSSFKYDIAYWYCQDDVDNLDKTKSISPLDVLDAIEKEKFEKNKKYTVWKPKNPKAVKASRYLRFDSVRQG
jgi:hypothetical protein